MAKQRLQVESGIAPGQLRPAAAPVDTFVRTNEGAQLDQLAQGLAKLAPSLGRFSTQLIDQQNTADIEAGKQLALDLKRQGKDYATEVRAGRLPPHRSPWFMAGLKETQGGIAAEKYNVDLQDAIRQDPTMQTTTNIEDYRRFATEFTKRWATDNGIDAAEPRFLTGFSSRANAYMVDNERRFESILGTRAGNQMIDAVFTQTKTNIQSELRRGTSLEQIAKSINSGTTFWMSLGANGGVLNRTTAAGVIAAARELALTGDDASYRQASNVLKLLTMLPGGPRGVGMISDQGWGSQMYSDALKEIGDLVAGRQTREGQEAAREKQAQIDRYQSDVLTALSQNPFVDIRANVAELSKLDPQAAVAMVNMQTTLATAGTYASSELVKEHFLTRIWTTGNVTPGEIMQAVHPNGLTAADGAWLNSQIEQARQSGGGRGPLGDPTLTAALAGLRDRFIDVVPTVDKGDAIAHVSATLRYRYLNWREAAGKESTPQQQIEWIDRELDAEVSQYRGATNISVRKVPPSGVPNPEQDWHTRALLTRDDLVRLIGNANGNKLTTADWSLVTSFGINTPAQLADFLRTQWLLANPKKTTSDSTSSNNNNK